MQTTLFLKCYQLKMFIKVPKTTQKDTLRHFLLNWKQQKTQFWKMIFWKLLSGKASQCWKGSFKMPEVFSNSKHSWKWREYALIWKTKWFPKKSRTVPKNTVCHSTVTAKSLILSKWPKNTMRPPFGLRKMFSAQKTSKNGWQFWGKFVPPNLENLESAALLQKKPKMFLYARKTICSCYKEALRLKQFFEEKVA